MKRRLAETPESSTHSLVRPPTPPPPPLQRKAIMADATEPPGGKAPKKPASISVSADQVAVVLAKLIEDRVSNAFRRHDKVVQELYSGLKSLNKEVSERYDIASSGPLPSISPAQDGGTYGSYYEEDEEEDEEEEEYGAHPAVKTTESRHVAKPAKPSKPRSRSRPRPRPGGRPARSAVTSRTEASEAAAKTETASRHTGTLPRYGEPTKGQRDFEERQRAFSAKQRAHRVGEAYDIVRKAKTAEAKSMIKRAKYARKHNGMRKTYNNVTSVTGKPRLGYKSRALSLARRQKIRMQTQRMLNERRHQEAFNDVNKASKLHAEGDEDRKGTWKLKSKIMKASNKALLRKNAAELRDRLSSKGGGGAENADGSEVVPRVANVNKSLLSHDRKFLAAAVQEQKRTLLETYGTRDVRHSRSVIYRPTDAPPPGADDPSDHFPSNNLQLEFIYGLGMTGEGGMHVCVFFGGVLTLEGGGRR